jgi:CheY-like chemotaxis protein
LELLWLRIFNAAGLGQQNWRKLADRRTIDKGSFSDLAAHLEGVNRCRKFASRALEALVRKLVCPISGFLSTLRQGYRLIDKWPHWDCRRRAMLRAYEDHVEGPLDPTSPIAVLMIEDDDVDRERARRMIASAAPTTSVVEVTTGQAAIASVSDRRFDVILLDFQLPDCTAVELLPSLQAITVFPCPVIILTGQGDEELAVWALQHGADDYLAKRRLTANRLCGAIEGSVTRWRTRARPRSVVEFDAVGWTPDDVTFRASLDGNMLWISESGRCSAGSRPTSSALASAAKGMRTIRCCP